MPEGPRTAPGPRRFAGPRIERFNQTDAIGAVEHAIDHERRRNEIVAVAQIWNLIQDGLTDRCPLPLNLQVGHVVSGNLVERRVLPRR